MKTKIYLTIVAFAAISMFSGCSKDGETGPVGPVGTDGTDGADGTNGTNGNANVSALNFTVAPGTDSSLGFKWNSNSAIYNHYHYNISEFTQSVVDSGAVMLYVGTGSGWRALPWTYVINSNTESRTYNFSYYPGYLQISIEQTTGTTQWSFTSTLRFKLVIIPSAAKVRRNLDLENYQAVKAAYNLKD